VSLPDLDLAGQAAIVTGAGRGLGRSHARLLASRGVAVVVCDPGVQTDGSEPSPDSADAVVAEIAAAGGRAIASYEDVSSAGAAQRLVAHALDAFGSLEIVVNNAGNLRDRTFAKTTLEDFEAVVRTHLFGSVNTTHAAWGHLQAAGYGRVVFTTSAAGLYGNFGQTAYGAAKMALIGLMHTLAIEGRRKNILVNTIAPIARTRMTQDLLPAEVAPGLDPDHVSPVVAYFCSRDCVHTSQTVEAAAGYFARVAVVEGAGLRIDPSELATPEDVALRWDEIADLEAARPYGSVTEAGEAIMTLAARRAQLQSARRV
jgi:NAD(P)-dependent dehydrogenase (short-subunit alcohol dehydrogenase family)